VPEELEATEVVLLQHPEPRETGNGPNVSYEEALLEKYFGPADENGVYGAVSDDA
jgi:hypothetical protein